MNPTGRFADRAEAYVTGRPSYPDAAIDVLLDGLGDPREMLVADIGAGTGISSRLLAARGARVLAIEPNKAMRDAAELHPLVEWIAATGEETGLSEASIDLVTAFQAFHWVDHAKALREFVRILRPGGRAAVVYNERDETDRFTAEYGALVRRFQTDDTEKRRRDALASFEGFDGWRTPRRYEFRNDHVVDAAGIIARARSTSYLPKDGPVAEELHAAALALFDRYQRGGSVAMVMKTIVATGDEGAG